MTGIQNNLFGIKWPTGVDMPLNKQIGLEIALFSQISLEALLK